MGLHRCITIYIVWAAVHSISPCAAKMDLPTFHDLVRHYPGYHTHSGAYTKHHLLEEIGCQAEFSLFDNRSSTLHGDTSALRLSSALNKIGQEHSLGTEQIHLSTSGEDSVTGLNGLQYIHHPLSFGPYLADKYGYPSVSKLHSQDPIGVQNLFWGQQGILRVITFRHKHARVPHAHVALWDCDHFHQSPDWIAQYDLLTVEFWKSPDSKCPNSIKNSPAFHYHNNHHHGHHTNHHQQHHNARHLIKTDPHYREEFLQAHKEEQGHIRHPKEKGFL